MLKKLFACVIFALHGLLFAVEIAQKEPLCAFSLQPYIALESGTQGEYVYTEDSSKLSYLEWEKKPLFLFGLAASADIGFFSLRASAHVALPGACGSVFDSDWLNAENSACTATEKAIKTNYTESQNKCDSFWSARIEAGLNFKPQKGVVITPFFGFEYTYSIFSAWGLEGYYADCVDGVYGPYNKKPNSAVKADSGVKGISLERAQFFLWLGFRNRISLTSRLQTEYGLAISPYAYVESLDTHVIRDLYFFDRMEGFFCGAKLFASVSYMLSRHTAFCLSAAYQKIGVLEGSTVYRSGSDTYYVKTVGGSGCDFESVSVSCGVNVLF